jgi:hypothetical protein
MKNWIIVALSLIALLLILRRTNSMYSSNCNPKLVDKNAVCAKIFPGKYEKDGTLSSDGKKKYCCQ